MACENQDIQDMERFYVYPAFVVTICILLAFLLAAFCAKKVSAEEIDLKAIAQIESSGNPRAWNKVDDGHGLYQITPIALKDYNQHHIFKLTMNDMWDPVYNKTVAQWIFEVRIPQMFKFFRLKDTPQNRIVAYNCGISCLTKKHKLPKTTNVYLEKYAKLVKGGAK